MDKLTGEFGSLLNKSNKKLLNPLLIQNVNLNTDFYSLTWNSLRIDLFEEKPVFRGHKIFMTAENINWLIINFILFISLVILTVSLLLYEVFTHDLYHDATWTILVLRVTLVAFAQKKLEPEFYQACVMFRFTNKNPEKFKKLGFAYILTLFRFFTAFITFFSIILFVCMANTALELIMNFAALAIISELDDWLGMIIVSDKPYGDKPYGEEEEHNNKLYDLEHFNEKLLLFKKMSLLADDLVVVDDQNEPTFEGSIAVIFSYIYDYFPWTLLPLFTLPMNALLLHIQTRHDEVFLDKN